MELASVMLEQYGQKASVATGVTILIHAGILIHTIALFRSMNVCLRLAYERSGTTGTQRRPRETSPLIVSQDRCLFQRRKVTHRTVRTQTSALHGEA